MAERRQRKEHDTPVSLILRLRDGTDAEWRRFWDIYGPVVYRLARRNGMNHHDAEDIVSEVMRGLHARIRRGFAVDRQKGRFRGYVARSVVHAVVRFRRRAVQSARVSAGALQPDRAAVHEPELAVIERRERLRVCLARLRELPDVRRRDVDAFEQYVIHEERAESVAKRFGISRGRVFGIRCEMIQRIRMLLADMDRELET